MLRTRPRKKPSQIALFLPFSRKRCQNGLPRGGGGESPRKLFFNAFFSLGRLLVPRVSPGSPQAGPRTHLSFFFTRIGVLRGTFFNMLGTLFRGGNSKNASPPSCLSACWGAVSAGTLRTGNHKRGGGVGRSPLDIYTCINICMIRGENPKHEIPSEILEWGNG